MQHQETIYTLRWHRWRSWERKARFAAVWGAFFALALFYIVPISAVQGLINVSLFLWSQLGTFGAHIWLPCTTSADPFVCQLPCVAANGCPGDMAGDSSAA